MQKMLDLLLLFVSISFGAAQFTGDKCTIRSDGSPGECKVLNKCPEALQALQDPSQSKFPQTCGFQGTVPIVCCPASAASQLQQRVPGKISKEKCKEYVQYIYSKRVIPILTLGEPVVTTRNECGFKVVELIVGGVKAKRKEFPHMAIIGYEPSPGDIQWKCGGSLISELYVMTAGHCLTSREFGDSKYVRIGMSNLNENSRRIQKLNIAERIPHPDYKPPSHYNDIGLLKFEKNADLNPYARPACLFTEFHIPTERAIASGWGKTDYAGEGSDDLRKVTLDFFDQNSCNQSYRSQIGRKLKNGIIEEIQVCAGAKGEDEEKDTCQGDSGGPLQIFHPEDEVVKCMYDIVGITSFGKACGIGKSPGIYTRVSKYIKWIEDNVWP